MIYTAVTDPVLAELANADGTPVGEITGTSDKLPVESQLKDDPHHASGCKDHRYHVQHQ